MNRARLETVVHIGRRQCAGLRLAFSWGLRCTVADNPRVDTAPRQFAAQTTEFDLGATVHDHFHARGFGARGSLVVAYAKLHPHNLCADGDRIIDDRPRLIGCTKDIHHVDLVRDVAQAGVDLFTKLFLARGARVHRNDSVTFTLQILHHEITWSVPVG